MIFTLTRNLRGVDYGWVEGASEGKLYSTRLEVRGRPDPNGNTARLSGALFAHQPLPEARKVPAGRVQTPEFGLQGLRQVLLYGTPSLSARKMSQLLGPGNCSGDNPGVHFHPLKG